MCQLESNITHCSTILSADPLPQRQGTAVPFVKWVGGKRNLLGELRRYLPNKFNNYYEPFVGGGALFFSLSSSLERAFLSDTNIDLLITYKVIQSQISDLLERLEYHAARHCKEYYYSVRNVHDLVDPVDVAARLIYLNKTCFNGLYRVNGRDEFNVPMGSYKNPAILNVENLTACSRALVGAEIVFGEFDKITPTKGDFVYFDPPYHPTTETSFTKYAKDDFSEKDQVRLCEFYKTLSKKGIYLMLSNSDTDFIRGLYSKYTVYTVEAPRFVNCKADKRGSVTEVLITNYAND